MIDKGRSPSALRSWWQAQVGDDSPQTDTPSVALELLRALVADSRLDLPLPGAGRTAVRFEALSTLGELDLTVARLAEAHADAVAILAELPHDAPSPDRDARWAVWASEPPNAVVTATADSRGRWVIDGRKAWCSGAGSSTHALVTAHAPDGPRLFAVDLGQPGVHRLNDSWPAPALSGTDTRSVNFDRVSAHPVGGPAAYIERPGFWHGAVGVAAVWYGGAIGVARTLARVGAERGLSELNQAHLGAVGAALTAGRAALTAAAAEFDADPQDRQGTVIVTARATRAVVEASATEVMTRVGRALGAAPLALDGDHARRVADLQLYLRQSHGDRDLADLGAELVKTGRLS